MCRASAFVLDRFTSLTVSVPSSRAGPGRRWHEVQDRLNAVELERDAAKRDLARAEEHKREATVRPGWE